MTCREVMDYVKVGSIGYIESDIAFYARVKCKCTMEYSGLHGQENLYFDPHKKQNTSEMIETTNRKIETELIEHILKHNS
jgi:hypothetical protein